MAETAWLTPNGEIYKLYHAGADGDWAMDRICRQGITSHRWVPVIVFSEDREGWREIDMPTVSKPYTEAAIPCCHVRCARPADFVFYPHCDGSEDARIYSCIHHTEIGLTSPKWSNAARWTVDFIGQEESTDANP